MLLAWFRKQHIRLNADIKAVKSRKATKMARKRLEIANKFLKSGDQKMFFDETAKAIWGYLGDKLKIPTSELTKENASEALRKHQVSEATITGINEILDSCEYARFARIEGSNNPEQVYSKTISLITKTENEIKN